MFPAFATLAQSMRLVYDCSEKR